MDLQEIINQWLTTLGGGILNFLAAIAFLVAGWLIALIVAGFVRAGLRRTDLDERLAKAIAGEDADRIIDLEMWISRIVFYVIFLFGVVSFLTKLNLDAVSGPLQALLTQASQFIPRLIGAAAQLVLAWVIASLVRFLITQIFERTKLDERISQQADLEDSDQLSLSKSLSTAAYWVIFLLFLPAVLSQLGVVGLVSPVQNMVDSILLAVPKAFSAGLSLLIGWFVARIVRQVVSNLLAVAGADKLGERIGLSGEQSLSKLVGTIVYALIMISTIIAALGELDIEAISGPASAMLSTALDAVPAIFGAALILVLAYLVARLVAGLVTSILSGVGFNDLPEKLGLRTQAMEGQRTPSEVAGYLVVVAVMLFAATEASNLLGFTLLAEMIRNFTTFAGQILLALIIFAIGFYLANIARSVILSTGGQEATFTANLARVAIVVFAGALALRQMGIADEIVNLAFGILLGALGVAAALAFGLGSRDLAGREVEKWLGEMRSTDSDSG